MARMKYLPCPNCSGTDIDLVKSVITKDIKRRYMLCFRCAHRWWTVEFLETVTLGDMMNHRKSGLKDQVIALKEELEQMCETADWIKKNQQSNILSEARRKMKFGDR